MRRERGRMGWQRVEAQLLSFLRLVDRLIYLTDSDRDAEAPLLPRAKASQPSIQLMRMALPRPPHMPTPYRLTSRSRTVSPAEVAAAAVRVGFVGDGHTPTNYLGVQRFIREGWPMVRERWGQAKLRLVGRPPTGHLPGQQNEVGAAGACEPRHVHCGWAWGTPCASNETRCGIDVRTLDGKGGGRGGY